MPPEAYVDSCRAILAIAVGRRDWADRIERAFADSGRFIEEVLTRDPK
jgi:hypothetical protein